MLIMKIILHDQHGKKKNTKQIKKALGAGNIQGKKKPSLVTLLSKIVATATI